jgi:site-specific recombinase XerC
MITVQPREPGPRCAVPAPGDMTCVTPRSGNRHTADHHQHETSAPESARQNRYTNPLHTASADRSRTYVSHLTEDGVDRRFIQVNVGHETDSSTAIYTHVSDDFMNAALRRALAPALEAGPGRREG